MLKKFFGCFFLLLALLLLALWSPWRQWDINLLEIMGIESSDNFASLKVRSLSGELEIYIDGELKGTANADDEDFAEITPISVGEHLITIKRASSENKYYEMSRKLNFEPGVDVVLAYDLGPNEYFSEGHLLYSRKNFSSENDPQLSLLVHPAGSEILLDGEVIGTAPLKEIQLDKSKQHKLKFQKEGYDPLEITILPEKQSDRDKLSGLDLILEVHLFAQPVKVTTAN